MEKHEMRIGDLIFSDNANQSCTCEVTEITRPRKVCGMKGLYKFVKMKLVDGRLPFGMKFEEGFYDDFVSLIHSGNLINLTHEKRCDEMNNKKIELWKNMKCK
jgi:hypothetical protein